MKDAPPDNAHRGSDADAASSKTTDAARLAWRKRREARREKQREQNLVRAAKMHEARVRFEREGGARSLHNVAEGSALQHSDERNPTKPPLLHVGCSGWYYWHWRDRFYPPGLPSNRWFDHYASQFRTVELNAPFYSWPTVANVATWIRQAGRRKIVYTVKVNELITHRNRMSGTKQLVCDFGHIADLLGPRMGCFLFQLPPSFHYSPAALKRVLAQLDPARRNVVEFRHKSWWNERVYDAFRQSGTIFCSCSGPRLPDELVKTADDVYIRFHGTTRWYRHDYSRDELAVWADRIRACGANQVWAYFNNDREGYAIKNARELLRQLKSDPRIQV